MLIDAIDSYFMYVKQQIAIIDSTQQIGGLMNARDWPQTPLIDGALYLLYLRAVPVGGTESQILYQYFCQWNWIILGTDLLGSQQAQNRGDRYRRGLKISSTLRSANYPSFTPKQSWSSDNQGNLTSVSSALATAGASFATNTESVWWSRLKFNPRVDSQKSGVEYGNATLEIYAWDDVAVAVA